MVVSLLNDRGVSTVVGTILLLGITVGLFSVVAGTVLMAVPDGGGSPLAEIVGSVIDDEFVLLHHGGGPVSLRSRVLLHVDGNVSEYVVGELLDPGFAADGWWDMGEQFCIPLGCFVGESVYITVVDTLNNQVIFKGFF